MADPYTAFDVRKIKTSIVIFEIPVHIVWMRIAMKLFGAMGRWTTERISGASLRLSEGWYGEGEQNRKSKLRCAHLSLLQYILAQQTATEMEMRLP